MSQDMIERVARELCRVFYAEREPLVRPIAQLCDKNWPLFQKEARAAIEAPAVWRP